MSFDSRIFFCTPPFTQLNTPYPATAYLRGYFNTIGVESNQADLGIDVILKLFSKEGLELLFNDLEGFEGDLSDNIRRIFFLQDYYLETIDEVIRFLQNNNPTLAHQICTRNYLPEAARFEQLDDMDWAFGSLGIRDKARHLATLYLEDISDLIKETIDPFFGFSRYAERLSLAAVSFDPLYDALNEPDSLISTLMLDCLEEYIIKYQPTVFCMSIPFPGNLFAGLKCGQYIKEKHPHIKVVLGGGYANTELRSLAEERFFEFVDFVCLDKGEASLRLLIEHIEGKRDRSMLKRTFFMEKGVIQYTNNALEGDVSHSDVGTPDYDGLRINEYLSVIEIANPMHRLWSDGRWNKLTIAHGCYWGKCTFCDVSLDYIANYQATTASILCDRIETIIEQTGENGFHFVDEAAPPALMRDLALEILRRGITISWWTNIRFEKSFTEDLCKLLSASGCIAVSGGLEVASDRLLDLIKKGVTVTQVAKVASNFTNSGIMVHAYLMYGFPTQTEQETINSLEMVRQLFEQGVVQSGFWHRFAMTAHSPVGMNPDAFKVKNLYPEPNSFANNDLYHDDPTGCDHDKFKAGLNKSLFNYMHGIGLDYPIEDWFDFDIPPTLIAPDYISFSIEQSDKKKLRDSSKLVWIGSLPELIGSENEDATTLIFFNKNSDFQVETDPDTAQWLYDIFEDLSPQENQALLTVANLKKSYEESELMDFDTFLKSSCWKELREEGLLVF
jgi:radical SAM superfamily enzyme YgiQ (UPF0313 family)